MSTSSLPTAPSPYEVLKIYNASYKDLLSAGQIKPLIYPFHFISVHLLLLYLLIPHTRRPWLYKARWLLFAGILAFEFNTLRERRCMSTSSSYAAGLIAGWTIVLSATLLIFRRPQFDFKRIEERKLHEKGKAASLSDRSEQGREIAVEGLPGERPMGKTNKNLEAEGTEELGTKDMKSNANGNGSTTAGFHSLEENLRDRRGNTQRRSSYDGKAGEDEEPKYYWQSYPDENKPFRERLSWVLDLVANFRGPGWSWAIPNLPPLPLYITSSLSNPSAVPSTKKLLENASKPNSETAQSNEIYGPVASASISNQNRLKFLLSYIALDIIRTIMMFDPYFYLGPSANSYSPPSHIPAFIAYTPFLLRGYRVILGFVSVILSLHLFFLSPQLLFKYPSIYGLRAHDFMYSEAWGSPWYIADHGLAGLWSGWWHQTFRFGFSSPSSYLIRTGWLDKRNGMTRIYALFIAFLVSGFLHFCGSVTSIGATNPLKPLAFFLLQAIGITIQISFTDTFHERLKPIPKPLRRLNNLIFGLGWMFFTGHLFLDDVSGGGIWLYEPFPVSVSRGLGFGREGEGWLCWGRKDGGDGVKWYSGRDGRWWESGLAIY